MDLFGFSVKRLYICLAVFCLGMGHAFADQSAASVRVLWWNTHNGRARLDKPDTRFSQNVVDLIKSENAPDILAFGEYIESSFRKQDLQQVQDQYPYRIFQPYPDDKNSGIAVFSRYPLTLASVDMLDYTPLDQMTAEEEAQYRKEFCESMCRRDLIILKVDVNGRTLNLAPVHLYDCWRSYMRKFGKFKTIQEVMWGTTNPLWYQIQRFRDLLQQRLGDELNGNNTLIVGDFNSPKDVFGIQLRAYGEIKQGLTDAIASGAATFPTPDSVENGHFPATSLDHAFVAPNVQVLSGEVLSLTGSDHYPLSVQIAMPAN